MSLPGPPTRPPARTGKRISVFLPTELLVTLMIHRLETGGSMSALIERICSAYVRTLPAEEASHAEER